MLCLLNGVFHSDSCTPRLEQLHVWKHHPLPWVLCRAMTCSRAHEQLLLCFPPCSWVALLQYHALRDPEISACLVQHHGGWYPGQAASMSRFLEELLYPDAVLSVKEPVYPLTGLEVQHIPPAYAFQLILNFDSSILWSCLCWVFSGFRSCCWYTILLLEFLSNGASECMFWHKLKISELRQCRYIARDIVQWSSITGENDASSSNWTRWSLNNCMVISTDLMRLLWQIESIFPTNGAKLLKRVC